MNDFIPTRGAQNKKDAEKLYIATTFKSHKKSNSVKTHNKTKNLHESEGDDDDLNKCDDQSATKKRQQELEMKRYRYDVIKFGMSGFEKREARQAKIELAISLGAKPPRNKRKNYKKLIQERKIQKAQEAKKEKFASGFKINQLSKNKKSGSQTLHNKKNKKSTGILDVYGKVTKENKKREKVKR